jgi:hypothetical protein
MQIILVYLQILGFAVLTGLFASIIATVGLLYSKRQSTTPWTISAAAAVVFFIAANSVWGYSGMIAGSLATILGPIGGYFLLALVLYQYMRDRKTTVIEERQ